MAGKEKLVRPKTVSEIKETQLWELNGTVYKIINVHMDAAVRLRCTLINVENGYASTEYRCRNIINDAAWKYLGLEKPKIAERYVTMFCSQGCGEIKLITPGEELKPFTCARCTKLVMV